MNSIHSDGLIHFNKFNPIQRIQCIPIFGFNPFRENSFTRSSGQSYASCKPRSSPAQAKDFKANIIHTLDIELGLKGLFTIFFLSLKSHILDTNGVWYSWFWSEGSVNSPNSKKIVPRGFDLQRHMGPWLVFSECSPFCRPLGSDCVSSRCASASSHPQSQSQLPESDKIKNLEIYLDLFI